MKRCKAIIAITLITSMLFAFSAVAFADDGATPSLVFDSKIEYNNEDTVKVNVNIDTAATVDMYSYITLKYDSEVFSISEENCSSTSSDGTFDLSEDGAILYSIDANMTYSAGQNIFSALFTVKDKSKVVGQKFYFDADNTDYVSSNGSADKTSSIIITSGTTVDPEATIDTNDDVKSNEITLDNGTKYINVPTYIGKVAVSGELNGKNVKITPVVKYDGTDVTSTLKKVDSIIIPGASFDKEGAKIEFKFAIVGAPTTGTIDLSATAAPVE